MLFRSMLYSINKNKKQLIKTIQENIKVFSLDNYFLYHNGLYISKIIAEINNMNVKLITKKYMQLPIKAQYDIKITPMEICEAINVKPSKILKIIMNDVEKQVLYSNIINEKEDIIKYVKDNYMQ